MPPFGAPPNPEIAETIVSEYDPPMIVQFRPDCWSSEPENHLDPAPPTVCSGLTAMACAGSRTARSATKTVNAEVSRAMAPAWPRYGVLATVRVRSITRTGPCHSRRDDVRIRRRARLLRHAAVPG